MPWSYPYDAPTRSQDYSPSRRGDTGSTSKVPGQEGLPKGLNESYYRETAAALGVPLSEGSRASSVPPQTNAVARRRSPSLSSSRNSSYTSDRGYGSRDRSRSRGDGDQSRGFLHNNFSRSRAGVGAGIAGALVGGLVARQASDIAFRQQQKKTGRARRHSAENMPRMVSTVLGAVAGGLSANAITHRLEDARERKRSQYLAWDDRYDRYDDDYYSANSRRDYGHYRTGGFLQDRTHYDRDHDLDNRFDYPRGREYQRGRNDYY